MRFSAQLDALSAEVDLTATLLEPTDPSEVGLILPSDEGELSDTRGGSMHRRPEATAAALLMDILWGQPFEEDWLVRPLPPPPKVGDSLWAFRAFAKDSKLERPLRREVRGDSKITSRCLKVSFATRKKVLELCAPKGGTVF